MPAPLVERAMASRTSRSPAGKRASQASWSVRAAEEALRQAIALAELDDRLSRLTWFEIGLAAEGPTPLDGAQGDAAIVLRRFVLKSRRAAPRSRARPGCVH